MRLSDFWRLMEDEFGSGYAHVLADDLVLTDLGGRTASSALAAGERPKRVWLSICEAQDVPEARRLGRDIKPRS
ncbi:histidine kinase [Kocuria polaris]|nr:histidine kinase [Kocuria polaris]